MHWVSGQSGQFDAERDLILADQTPAQILFLSAADTDLAAVAGPWGKTLGDGLRLCHAAPLRQPVAADHFVRTVVAGSRLLVARLLGGEGYFPHLIQALADLRQSAPAGQRVRLLLLSGTNEDERTLRELSDFPATVRDRMHHLLAEGGMENFRSAGDLAARLASPEPDPAHPLDLPPVIPMPSSGWLRPAAGDARVGNAWITYYRAWHQTGDLAVVEALVEALVEKGLRVRAFYSDSLREESAQHELLRATREEDAPDLLLTLHSFSIAAQASSAADKTGQGHRASFPDCLDCPVLQVPVSSRERAAWESSGAGLTPAETAIQIALPEMDGRILCTVAGFKEELRRDAAMQCTLKRLVPAPDQIEHIAESAVAWARLRKLPASEKRVAVILSNYPNRDGRIGNGVGLDTPASAVALLNALQSAGYTLGEYPRTSTDLMRRLLESPTNDPFNSYGKTPGQTYPRSAWDAELAGWPEGRREEILRHWSENLFDNDDSFPIAGVQFGNVFLGIQPPRGFSLQDQAIYHSPDLPPPPLYCAFYLWVRKVFKADAIIHLGKHGNLEWLPGRATALGKDDYPRLCLGPLPHLYPFIVNNPGEGTQAKRRTAGVILDHLTPPLSRAGLYGELEQLERLLEEHSHACALYPRRAAEIEIQIQKLIDSHAWKKDLPQQGASLPDLSNFLCELKESQIRSGLHVLGAPPAGEKEIDFLLSLLRLPNGSNPGLLAELARISWANSDVPTLSAAQRDDLDAMAKSWIRKVLDDGTADDGHLGSAHQSPALDRLAEILRARLRPCLQQTTREITFLLRGLEGRFVPPGPAGAPTRGRSDVLPTGRNFYALDPRIIPTPLAWSCGKALAECLLKRHFQDHGEPLRTLALVVWGTSNMRTGGDDLAQALWLWGCEPVWEESSGRVVDFHILPLSLLGRPRVDITLRVSGLFRDAFGDTVRLLATIPKRLAALDEPPELNPIRAAWLADCAALLQRGTAPAAAERSAALRVFTSAPGCYGSGLLPLLDAGNWDTREDIARVFLRWGHHSVGTDGHVTPEPEALERRLGNIQAVAQNQDNREHDILDSDDYFQFQGGLHAAVTALRGTAPASYHGDSSVPESPRVRALEEELVRVLHSRVLNPRWIAAMQQHGYKGAFEMAATIDYLFGYGATTGLVRDHHYESAAHKLAIDPEPFFREHNPDALRESTGRLLEAANRGLWKMPDPQTLTALENIHLSLEAERE